MPAFEIAIAVPAATACISQSYATYSPLACTVIRSLECPFWTFVIRAIAVFASLRSVAIVRFGNTGRIGLVG